MDYHHHGMTEKQYKAYHEAFMGNNDGSSALYTFSCIFFTILCTIITSVITSYGFELSFILEYVLIVLPMILAYTVFADWIYTANVCLIILLLKLLMFHPGNLNLKALFDRNLLQYKHMHSITLMRGLTYLITIFSILAVDFKVFPRSLAKTEKYGYSLMDTGVGLFILMSGLVHRSYPINQFKLLLRHNAHLIAILTTFGATRYVFIKQLEYHEHITEYGVHWNFFFTLATVKALAAIITLIIRQDYLIPSFIILIFHEYYLAVELENWVFVLKERDSVMSANKEGIVSLLGYLSLYLFAIHTRKLLYDNNKTRRNVVCHLLLLSAFLWILSYVINIYRPTSRTLANAGYCTFVEALFLSITTLLYIMETCISGNIFINIPAIAKVLNKNGFMTFIVANLFTGAINLSLRTLFVQNFMAFLILNTYMVSVILFGVFTYQ